MWQRSRRPCHDLVIDLVIEPPRGAQRVGRAAAAALPASPRAKHQFIDPHFPIILDIHWHISNYEVSKFKRLPIENIKRKNVSAGGRKFWIHSWSDFHRDLGVGICEVILFGSLFFQFVSCLIRDNVLSTFEFNAGHCSLIRELFNMNFLIDGFYGLGQLSLILRI